LEPSGCAVAFNVKAAVPEVAVVVYPTLTSTDDPAVICTTDGALQLANWVLGHVTVRLYAADVTPTSGSNMVRVLVAGRA
jgi:hypothetical protein